MDGLFGAAPRVLVVEDEPGFRELCVELLAGSGYHVESTGDGQQALDRVERENFHLILADINMPVMDGLTLLKIVKTKHPDIEVVLMTAYGGLHSAVEAMRHGAYDYITKPFTRESLLASLGRALERQRLAEELKRVQGQLIEKQRLAALGGVSGWLAHRMRNPLNVIQMCAQYLKTRFDDGDERREVALAIEDKVKVLERMTHDFIRFSRDYQPRLRPEDLHEIVNDALNGIASRISLQNVKVEKRYEEPLPLVVVDKELVEEVLGYLLENAVEAMQGPGEILLRAGRVPQGVFLDVVNTGPGIPRDVRARLFDPFFTTKERGTGLGLAIARRVIESHGGSLTLREGEPTTFHALLPAQPNGAGKAP